MDAFDIARAVRRQWGLSAILVILGAAVLAAVAVAVPPQFHTSASLLVLREPGPASPNPYGLTDPAQVQTSTLLVDVLESPTSVANLAPPGVLDELSVSNESGPVQERTGFLSVDVRAATAEDTKAIAERVVQEAQNELGRRQDAAAVPATERLRVDVVVPPDIIESSSGARWRAVGILGALELALIAVVVAVVDRRSRRRRQEGTPEPYPTPPFGPPSTGARIPPPTMSFERSPNRNPPEAYRPVRPPVVTPPSRPSPVARTAPTTPATSPTSVLAHGPTEGRGGQMNGHDVGGGETSSSRDTDSESS